MARVLARSERVAVFKDSHLTICGDAALSRLLRSGCVKEEQGHLREGGGQVWGKTGNSYLMG